MEQSADHQDPVPTESFAHCYESVKEELTAIPEGECETVNLDPQKTAMEVKRALPHARTLRTLIVEQAPKFDITLLDHKLDTYAGALFYAQVLVDMSSKPPAALQTLSARAGEVREVVIADVTLMIKRGLLPSNCLANLQGAVGYRPVAADIMLGVSTLRADQNKVQGKSSITAQELDDYEAVAAALVNAAAERELAQSSATAATLNRARVYTLLKRGYERLRSAVAFVRQDEGDGDEFTHSLFVRGPRRKPEPEQEEPAPSATPAAPSAPAVNAHAFTPAPNGATIPPGLPGSSPFLPG
jgi:hypothetical protein